jgi:adenylyltransferase/sulfurtransferase
MAAYMKDQQLLRYCRHILLQGINLDVQQRLIDTKAHINDCGGLGWLAALYLAPSGNCHG